MKAKKFHKMLVTLYQSLCHNKPEDMNLLSLCAVHQISLPSNGQIDSEIIHINGGVSFSCTCVFQHIFWKVCWRVGNYRKINNLGHDYIIVFVFYYHCEPEFLIPYSDSLYVAEQGLIPRLLIHSCPYWLFNSTPLLSWYWKLSVCLTLRLLMSYIYGAPILDVSRSHTTTHHSR